MKIERRYIMLCKNYQKILRRLFNHRWRTGQLWIAEPYIEWDTPHIFDEDIYTMERLRRDTFLYVDRLVTDFQHFEPQGLIVWVPTIWDIQRLIYSFGTFDFSDVKEMRAKNLAESLKVVFKYLNSVYDMDEKTYEAFKSVRGAVEHLLSIQN